MLRIILVSEKNAKQRIYFLSTGNHSFDKLCSLKQKNKWKNVSGRVAGFYIRIGFNKEIANKEGYVFVDTPTSRRVWATQSMSTRGLHTKRIPWIVDVVVEEKEEEERRDASKINN